MTTSAKAIGAAASSLILLGSAALAAAPAVMDITADASPAAATQQATEASAAAEATGVQRVEGQFSYDQGVVTSNETIASVFAKAAATLCQTTADGYGVYTAQAIKVSVAGLPTMEATVAEMAEEEGAYSYVLGCSCASNAPGGGAIANAEVSGVSLASLMTMAAA